MFDDSSRLAPREVFERGVFRPTKRWQHYLERLKTELPRDDMSLKAAIRLAERVLAGPAPGNQPHAEERRRGARGDGSVSARSCSGKDDPAGAPENGDLKKWRRR